MGYQIELTHHDEKPIVTVLHIGSNDKNNQISDKVNSEKLTEKVLSMLVNVVPMLYQLPT